MPASNLLLALALLAAADNSADEARIEQLLHQPAAPPRAPAAHATNKVDTTAALLGHKVRVRTVDGGLYAGTLQAGDAASITLRIELPTQALNYTLPRSGVAEVENVEPAP